MNDAGIKGDTISFTAAINACARTGDVQLAEKWMAKMLEAGVEPNVITFNAVIAACAKAGDGKRCEQWLEKMRRAGVQPNSFTYNSAAKPFVVKGDYERVEQYMQHLRSEGSPLDDFCLTSLLHAYGNAKPKQPERAHEAVLEFLANGGQLSDTSKRALQRVGASEGSKYPSGSKTKAKKPLPSSRGANRGMQAPPGLTNENNAASPESLINFSAYDWE